MIIQQINIYNAGLSDYHKILFNQLQAFMNGENEILLRLNRAAQHAFNKDSLMVAVASLAVMGLIFIFFQLGTHTGSAWTTLAFQLFPYFLNLLILFAAGILLTSNYQKNVMNQHTSLYELATGSLESLTTISSLIVPTILIFIVLWLCNGIFTMLTAIPAIGAFLNAILAFIPFTICLILVAAIIAGVAAIYFAAPIICIKRTTLKDTLKIMAERFFSAPISHIAAFAVAAIPFALSCLLLAVAYCLTQRLSHSPATASLEVAIANLSMLIPITVLLAPSLVLFFNLGLESYAYFKNK